MTAVRFGDGATGSLQALANALGFETSRADLRSLYLGFLAQEPMVSLSLGALPTTWAKVDYLLRLFDRDTAQLYFDEYLSPVGHLIWTYVPADLDPAVWLSALPLVAPASPKDHILVLSMAARNGAVWRVRRELQRLSAHHGMSVVYLRRRGRQIRLLQYAMPSAHGEHSTIASVEFRGNILDVSDLREVVLLRLAEGRLMQAFARFASESSSQHAGRIRTPLMLGQFGLSTDRQGETNGLVTWAWCKAANEHAFESNPYELSPALWREGSRLKIVDALGDWQGALRSAIDAGRLAAQDIEELPLRAAQ